MLGVDRLRSVAETELDVFASAELCFESLAGAGNGVALVVEERLDAKGHFDIAPAKEPLAGAALVRPELGELALPEAQDVGRNLAEFRDFPDAEVEFIGDLAGGRGSLGACEVGSWRCHMPNSIGQGGKGGTGDLLKFEDVSHSPVFVNVWEFGCTEECSSVKGLWMAVGKQAVRHVKSAYRTWLSRSAVFENRRVR